MSKISNKDILLPKAKCLESLILVLSADNMAMPKNTPSMITLLLLLIAKYTILMLNITVYIVNSDTLCISIVQKMLMVAKR
ncbi:MAG: hypothetical protein DHS20C13_29130 [Thermodesulfobacteriota bacterium]|nr:MAG: hypothetical protein DHS20C13_29130 [Thermodesulfobacteriota bacterium]